MFKFSLTYFFATKSATIWQVFALWYNNFLNSYEWKRNIFKSLQTIYFSSYKKSLTSLKGQLHWNYPIAKFHVNLQEQFSPSKNLYVKIWLNLLALCSYSHYIFTKTSHKEYNTIINRDFFLLKKKCLGVWFGKFLAICLWSIPTQNIMGSR